MVKIDKIFLINLPSRPDRLENATANLKKLGGMYEQFEYFEAVNGKALSEDELMELVTITGYKTIKEGRVLDYQLPSRGAVGCALSHYRIWQKMIDNNYQNIIVFEDDLNLNKDVDKKLVDEFIDNIPADYGIAFMDYMNVDKDGFEEVNKYWKETVATAVYKTTAYVINIEAAKKFLTRAYPIDMQVDLYINHYSKYNGVKRYYSDFCLFIQGVNDHIGTDIQDKCWKCVINSNLDNPKMLNKTMNQLIGGAIVLGIIIYITVYRKKS
jgi:GR25 family glycosyltransferase involved in LPS biosynthesis